MTFDEPTPICCDTHAQRPGGAAQAPILQVKFRSDLND